VLLCEQVPQDADELQSAVTLSGVAGGDAVDDLTQLVNLTQVLAVGARHEVAPVRNGDHESLPLQGSEGGLERRLRSPESFGEHSDDQLLSGGETPVDDGGPHGQVGGYDQGLPRQRAQASFVCS